MKFHKPIHFLSAGVVLSGAGLGLALISAVLLAQGYAARTWPTTDARIIRSEVVETQKAGGVRRGLAAFNGFYEAKIEYQYTVNGREFVGDQVAIGEAPQGFDPSVANAAVAKYPLGSQVTISYNPRQPDNAVIDPKVNVGLWWAGVVLGLVALSAGVVFWLKAIKIDETQRAATEIRAAPRRAAMPAWAAAARAPMPAPPARQIRVHWLLRTPAVLTGLVLFFFGSFALPIAAKLRVGANPAGPLAAEVIAYLIVLGMVGAIALLGAFLIWFGMKRSIRLISFRSAGPAAAAEVTAVELPALPQAPDFGAFIAQCGPQKSGQTHYVFIGAILMFMGVFSFFAPFTAVAATPEEAAAVKWGMWLVGGFMLLGGIGMLWHTLFGHNQEICLYERGIVERVGATSYAVSLDEIEHLRVQEFYEHRFAPRTFNVRAKVRGEKELSFSSALRGESERIIAYLAERVAQTEMVPFQA